MVFSFRPVTDLGGELTTAEELPKIVISVGAIGVAVIIGLIVSKIADYCYDRQSLKDDASDMSDHTRQLLKARITVLKFRSALVPKKKKKENPRQRAYRYARFWLQKTRARKRARDIEKGIIPVDGKKDSKGVTLVSVKTVDEIVKNNNENKGKVKIDLTSKTATPVTKENKTAFKSVKEEESKSSSTPKSTQKQTSTTPTPRSTNATPNSAKSTSKSNSPPPKITFSSAAKANSSTPATKSIAKLNKVQQTPEAKANDQTGKNQTNKNIKDSANNNDSFKCGTARPTTAERPSTAGRPTTASSGRGNVSIGGRPAGNAAAGSRPGTAVNSPGTDSYTKEKGPNATIKSKPGIAKRV